MAVGNGWVAGFCRYLIKDPTAQYGQDKKMLKLREALGRC